MKRPAADRSIGFRIEMRIFMSEILGLLL